MPEAVVGRVAELWRYPVKSMQGERVSSLEVGGRGVTGDRRFGLVDRTSGQLLSAKTVPELLTAEVVGRGQGGGVTIRLPDGTSTSDDDEGVDAVLSEWLGRDVALRSPDPSSEISYRMTFDPADDGAATVDIPSPAGTFLDLTPVHLLTTGSLETCTGEHPGGDWNRRRFRPNVLVETEPTTEPFPEDAWVGRTVEVGDAVLEVPMRMIRCAMPVRAQPGRDGEAALERDVDVYRTLARLNDNYLGVCATVTSAATVATGDAVALAG